MKKNSILLFAMTLIIEFCFTPSVMAKEKKVKYLGHNYRGEVNDKKIPAGEGTMNVNGLLIKGDFDDHSAKDAEVWRTDYMGTSNTTFEGTITYDDSNNIVLKTGGVLKTKYYLTDYEGSTRLVRANPYFVKDTLKEDRVVNSSNFEPKELKIPVDYQIQLNDGFEKLNPPVVKISYSVGLTHVNNCNGQKIDMDVFCIYPRNGFHISDYKDGEGRIWDYDQDPVSKSFTVKYPNGSYCNYSYYHSDYKYDYNCSWEIHYPDGKIVTSKYDGKNEVIYYIGKLKLSIPTNQSIGSQIDFANCFYNNLKKEKFTTKYYSNLRWIDITSESYNFEKLSNSEVERIIREEVIPFIENGEYEHLSYNVSSGYYINGKFFNKKQEKAKKEAEEKRNHTKAVAYWTKRFGFNPETRTNGQLISVGRSFKLLCDWYKSSSFIWFDLVKQTGSSKCYQIKNGSILWGHVWVTGDKVSSVTWYK